MDTELVVKVRYGDTLRRFSVLLRDGSLDLDMAGLRAKISDLFKFTPNADLTLTYEDEDGDVVTLVDDVDLRDAIKQRLDPLRLTVSQKTDFVGNFDRSGSSTSSHATSVGQPFPTMPPTYPLKDRSHMFPVGQSSYALKPSVPFTPASIPAVTPRNSEPKASSSSEAGSGSERLFSTLVQNLASKVASAAPEQYRDFVSGLSFELASKAAAASPAPLIELVETLSKMAISQQDPVSKDQNGVDSEKHNNDSEKSEDSKSSKKVEALDQMLASQSVSVDKKESPAHNAGNSTRSISTPDAQIAATANISHDPKNTGQTSGSGFSPLLCCNDGIMPPKESDSCGLPIDPAGKMPSKEYDGNYEYPITGTRRMPVKASDGYYGFPFPATTPYYPSNPGYSPSNPGYSPTAYIKPYVPGYSLTANTTPYGPATSSWYTPTVPAVALHPDVSPGYSPSRPSDSVTCSPEQPVALQNKHSSSGEIPPVAPQNDSSASASGDLGLSESNLATSGGVHTVHPRRGFYNSDNMGRVFHQGVRCDGCGVHPIVGPRYKSRVKENYDLCSICFAELGNEAEYSRIDRPICYRSHRLPKISVISKVHDLGKTSALPAPRGFRRCGLKSSYKVKLDSRFIEDVNIVDGTLMAPSSPFTKIWRMHNNGVIAWPLGTRIVWIGGDKLTELESFELELPVQGCRMGMDLDIAINFTAPAQPGQYVSYWRMALPNGHKFGQCVWVLIQVESPPQRNPQVESPPQRNPQFEGCQSLNLNLPPDSGDVRDQIIDVNVEPADAVGSSLYPDLATDLVNQMVGEMSKEMEASSDDLVNCNAIPVEAPAAESYPAVECSTGPSEPVPPVEVPAFLGGVSDENTLEQSLLKELEEMGFMEVNLNKRILRANDYDLAQSLDELCSVAEWDPMLEELQEMGFNDKETNRRLLIKNGGSIKRVVMDLIAAEKA